MSDKSKKLEELVGAWSRYKRWFDSGDTFPQVPHPDEWSDTEIFEITTK
jgi:hypothetical protein